MLKNTVEPDRSQMTIWLTCIACWITKATNTLSEHVIPISFPPQQWLHEIASVLLCSPHCFSFMMKTHILDLPFHGTPSFAAVLTLTWPYTLPWNVQTFKFLTNSLLISSTMFIPLSNTDIPIGTLVFPPKFERIYNLSPTHVTRLAHPTVFGSFNWTMLGDGHKLRRVSLISFLLTPVIFFSLCPSCLFGILFSSSVHDNKSFGTVSNESMNHRINIRTQTQHGIQHSAKFFRENWAPFL